MKKYVFKTLVGNGVEKILHKEYGTKVWLNKDDTPYLDDVITNAYVDWCVYEGDIEIRRKKDKIVMVNGFSLDYDHHTDEDMTLDKIKEIILSKAFEELPWTTIRYTGHGYQVDFVYTWDFEGIYTDSVALSAQKLEISHIYKGVCNYIEGKLKLVADPNYKAFGNIRLPGSWNIKDGLDKKIKCEIIKRKSGNSGKSATREDVEKLFELSKDFRPREFTNEKGEKETVEEYDPIIEPKLESALDAIKTYDNYFDWIQMGMALKNWNSDVGLKLWKKWSKNSAKYSEEACEDKWETFDDNCTKPRTAASIFFEASKNGWLWEDEKDYGYNHTVLSKRLVAAAKGYIHYCPEMSENKFIIWNGKTFEQDRGGKYMGFTPDVQKLIDKEWITDGSPKADAAKKKFICNLANEAPMKSIGNVAKQWLCVDINRFDSHENLLNTPTGILDLTNGSIMPHDPRYMMTMTTSTEYVKGFKCDMFDKYLDDVTEGNKDLIHYLQLIVGASMYGRINNQHLYVINGIANSGKSTFIEGIKAIMGDYASTANIELFLENKYGSPTYETALLRGKRIVLTSELPSSKKFNSALIKSLTSGDIVSARAIREAPFNYRPKYKIWMATNVTPSIDYTDSGMWKRIKRIPFETEIKKENENKQIKADAENPNSDFAKAFMAWGVGGAIEVKKINFEFNEPEVVKSYINEFKIEQDPLIDFIEDCIEITYNRDDVINRTRVYEKYTSWMRDKHNFYIMSKQKFYLNIAAKGIVGRKMATEKQLIGIKIKETVQEKAMQQWERD